MSAVLRERDVAGLPTPCCCGRSCPTCWTCTCTWEGTSFPAEEGGGGYSTCPTCSCTWEGTSLPAKEGGRLPYLPDLHLIALRKCLPSTPYPSPGGSKHATRVPDAPCFPLPHPPCPSPFPLSRRVEACPEVPDVSTPIEEVEGLEAGSEKSLYGTFPQSALDPVLERLKEVQVCRGEQVWG